MTDRERLDAATQALRDVIDPVARLRRLASPDDPFDPIIAGELAGSVYHAREIARSALVAIGEYRRRGQGR
jgi:hypothetical protein